MIKQLGLTRSKKLLFVKVVREQLDDNDGLTSNLAQFGAIVILLKPQSFEKLGVTLAHEMVHVKQMAKGTLKTVKGINYWNGRRYSKRTKYLDQPWEIEAFSKQELIFRRAIE
jgi:hypothetical protein